MSISCGHRGVRREKNTPLLTASGTGVEDVVACLLDARADVKARNSNNKSALDKARASSGSTASVLEAAGASATPAQETRFGRTRCGTANQRQARGFRSQEDEFPWAWQAARSQERNPVASTQCERELAL